METRFMVMITSTSFGRDNPLPLKRLEDYGCEVICNPYGRPLTEDELLPLLKEADGVIAGLDKFTERVMMGAPRLKVISRYGVGLDNVDLQAAKHLGIAVTTTAEANTQAVADLVMGLLLAVSRRIPQAHQSLRRGKWEKFIGHAVYGKTLGIIGLGRIGKAVAKRANGFEMNILAHDVREDESFAASLGIRFLPLAELLARADFVTLHCDLNPRTKRLIGARELNIMKKTAYLINTARGGLVDEEALFKALRMGTIAGAALDTYTHEPPGKSPLMTLENIITTPHIASYTQETLLEMGLASVENLIKAIEGRCPGSPR